MSEQTLHLVAGDPARDALIVGKVVLVLADKPVTLELAVPQGPVGFEDLLPILHGLTDHVVEAGIEAALLQGRSISCRAGCGACCRQLVPVSQAEARAIAGLVTSMPEAQRLALQRRFDEALLALHEAGTLAEVDAARAAEVPAGDLAELGLRYFRIGVACPFLEGEACSIHAHRPLVCRQYLVTSPAANCASPSPDTIEMVAMPARPSQALLAAQNDEGHEAWMPLVYALGYASEVPARVPTRTAAEILRDVFGRLSSPGGAPEPTADEVIGRIGSAVSGTLDDA